MTRKMKNIHSVTCATDGSMNVTLYTFLLRDLEQLTAEDLAVVRTKYLYFTFSNQYLDKQILSDMCCTGNCTRDSQN